MADQLPQIPHLRRGDPRLRQPTHAQQVRQIGRVTEVVLHPPVGERLHPQRVGQVHVGADRGQHVRRPVPAVRRLQHDLGLLAGAAHDLRQQLGIVADPHRLQHLAVLIGAADHRSAPVQVDPDELLAVVCCAHRGLLHVGM
jgi:CHASE2 domain-containing sensor protein